MRAFLDRLIPRQPGYPVEVGVVAGEVGGPKSGACVVFDLMHQSSGCRVVLGIFSRGNPLRGARRWEHS